jgi:hypothetical protein
VVAGDHQLREGCSRELVDRQLAFPWAPADGPKGLDTSSQSWRQLVGDRRVTPNHLCKAAQPSGVIPARTQLSLPLTDDALPFSRIGQQLKSRRLGQRERQDRLGPLRRCEYRCDRPRRIAHEVSAILKQLRDEPAIDIEILSGTNRVAMAVTRPLDDHEREPLGERKLLAPRQLPDEHGRMH